MKKKLLQSLMKSARKGFFTIPVIALLPIVVNAQIHGSSCTPSFGAWGVAGSGTDYDIAPFILTGASGTSIHDATAATAGYMNEIATYSCTLNAGTTYPFTVGGSDAGEVLSAQVWIDFNNDGSFDSSEIVGGAQDYANGTSVTGAGNIVIPPGSATIVAGAYRMRVVQGEYVHGSSYPSSGEQYYPQLPPCPTAATVASGQCRDYAVTIATPPVYTVFPTAITFAPTAPSATSPTYNVHLDASYLTPASGSLTVTAPAGFMVNNGSSWVSTYTISYSAGTLAVTAIPVQFAPTSATSFSGNLTITGGGISVSISLSGLGAAACSGTPTAGTATATPDFANDTETITLTDAGYSTGGGITFQWMSATSAGGPFTAIANAVTPIYTFKGLSADMYYYCEVGCASATANTNTVFENYFPATCIPYFLESYTDCAGGAGDMSPVTMTGAMGTSLNDVTPCNGTGYIDETANTNFTLLAANTYSMDLSILSAAQAWIDFNNDGIFESSESVGGGDASPITITIPAASLVNTGTYRMRVESVNVNVPETGETLDYPDLVACATDSFEKHGEARDYKVLVISSTAISNVNNTTPEVMIYPNPTQGLVNIRTKANVNVVVSSMMGSEILHVDNTKQVDLGTLANGVYLISVYDAATGLKIKTSNVTKITK